METGNIADWGSDWAWGLPLIVATVVFHTYRLGFINKDVTSRMKGSVHSRHVTSSSAFIIGGIAVSVTVLHGLETLGWAMVYRFLGASPNFKSAMLYSLSAMTSHGHANLYLDPHWQMMGALEALNGWIVFGLTTAFLFTVLERAWSHTARNGRIGIERW